MKLVSVIIPVWNRENLVKRAVQSVFAQTYPFWELILVDDGSSDNTRKILEDLQEEHSVIKSKNSDLVSTISVFSSDINRGVSFARNLGFSKAKGEWIAFLDSDDQWFPLKLEKQMQFHSDNPSFSVSQTKEKWNKKGNWIPVPSAYQKRNFGLWEQSLEICAVTPSSAILKRKLLEEMNGFDENLLSCEDYDLWLRIQMAGFEIPCLEEALLVRYGGHKDQLSQKFTAIERFRLYSQIKILKKARLTESPTNDKTIVNSRIESLQISAKRRLNVLLVGRRKRNLSTDWLLELEKFLDKYPSFEIEEDGEGSLKGLGNLLKGQLFP